MSTPPPLPTHNPYAAPLARVDEAPVGELVLADRGIRFLAALLDGLAFGVVGIIAAIAIPALQPVGATEPDTAMMVVLGLVVGGGFIALIVLNCLWLHRYGQTIGKRALKIKVVRGDGSRCALSRVVFARWLPVTLIGQVPLLGAVFSLVDVLFIFREDHRCIHDMIADTIVIKA